MPLFPPFGTVFVKKFIAPIPDVVFNHFYIRHL